MQINYAINASPLKQIFRKTNPQLRNFVKEEDQKYRVITTLSVKLKNFAEKADASLEDTLEAI